MNGASVDRQKKRALPRAQPASGAQSIVQDAIARAVVAEHEAKIRTQAVGFLDRFINLFAAYSQSSKRSHKRRPPKASSRRPAEILAELNAFYARRPRPWRWHGNR